MAWNWTEYKRLPRRKGFLYIMTALAISGGALLWYERDDPLYVAPQDIAELWGALEERYALTLSWFWAPYDSATNKAVYYYASREFFTTTVPWYVTRLDNKAHAQSTVFLDLWGEGGSTGPAVLEGRSLNDYYTVILDDDEILMDAAWWTNNIWSGASEFGDYEYTHTNCFYVSTNLLNEIAKPLSAMRWRAYNYSAIATNGATGVAWRGESSEQASKDMAITIAVQNCIAASAEDYYENPIADANDLLTNGAVCYHNAYVDNVRETNGIWAAEAWEVAYVQPWRWWIPPATNVVVYEMGAFVGNYHPTRPTNEWVTAEVKLQAVPAGTSFRWDGGGVDAGEYQGCREVLHVWDGRFDAFAMGRLAAQMETAIGWIYHMYNEYPTGNGYVFLADWQFQCLTNRAHFWE